MPFDFNDYERHVRKLSDKDLHDEYRRYCNSAGKSGLGYIIGLALIPPTLGASAFGSIACGASGTNAGVKIDIIKREKASRA